MEREPARCAENKKRGGENVEVFNVITEFSLYRLGFEVTWHFFPSIGGWDAPRKGAHRYGPIGENFDDATFSA